MRPKGAPAGLARPAGAMVRLQTLFAVAPPFDDFDHLGAIVSCYPFGFEGTDRRFLAVPPGQ